MSRLGVKSSVYHGDDSCLGELDVIPVKVQNFQFPNNEIRIHRISPRSQRCRPLPILQTISPSSVCCKLESSSPFQQPNLINLHAICYRNSQTAVVLVGDEEIHLVAMRSKLKKYPCFWCYSVPKGLYNASLAMLNVRCLPIVFDLDETLVAANSMRSFEDKIGVLRGRITSETDPLRLAEMNGQVKRYEDDRLILKQYAESDSVMDDGKVLKVQAEEVPLLSDDHETKLVRPVIRLQEKNIVLTRIFPDIRDTSVLVRLRPAWEVMRSYLTTGRRKRFEVFVCTMAERNYALEMWRLLDPEGLLIGSNQLRDRVVCVKSGSKKSLMNVFQGGICPSRMAMVMDDRLDVWEDKDQPQIHEVPPFTPYYAPEAETANNLHVLRIAKNVVEHVRKCFFEDFDGSLLRKTTDVFYEDGVVNLPSSPDMSSYLASTLEKMLLLYSLYHENKFTGQNYIEWKHNLIEVLNGENCTHVLTEPCPKEPAQGATKDTRMSYEKWQHANERAKKYIIASISNVFQTKYQKMASVAEIMESLEQMFSQGTHSEKEVVPSVLNKRIGVHDHDLDKINYRNDPKGQGAKIDDNAKIHLVLESLQEPYKQLKELMVNNLNQLINSANKGSINKTKVDPSRPKPKGLRKKNKKKKKIVPKKLSTKKYGKPKGKCFKCGEKGHWKKDCLKLIKSCIGHSSVC